VTAAVGTVREQVARIAADLTAAEREVDRLDEVSAEIEELQSAIDRWIADARQVQHVALSTPDVERRRNAFLDSLRTYLLALGHSAIRAENAQHVHFDDQYVPYLSQRRLRSLGSGSDQPRLIAAYALALAAGSQRIEGLHPGVVILDEPLQQNPDEPHRNLFLSFLSQELAQRARFQTLVFTSLRDDELDRLRAQGTSVLTPPGDHFLQLTEGE